MEGFFEQSKEVSSEIRIVQGEIAEIKQQIRKFREAEKNILESISGERTKKDNIVSMMPNLVSENLLIKTSIDSTRLFLNTLETKERENLEYLAKMEREKNEMLLELTKSSTKSRSKDSIDKIDLTRKQFVQLTRLNLEAREILSARQIEYDEKIKRKEHVLETLSNRSKDFEERAVQFSELKKLHNSQTARAKSQLESNKLLEDSMQNELEILSRQASEIRDFKGLKQRLQKELDINEKERVKLENELESLRPKKLYNSSNDIEHLEEINDEIVYW